MSVREVYVEKREPEHIFDNLIFLCSMPEFDSFRVVGREFSEVADLIFRNLGVERKTVKDYNASIIDGRIYNQLYDLSQNFQYAAVIVSGNPKSLGESREKALYTMAVDTFFRYNIPTISVSTDDMLCYTFLKMCRALESDLQPKKPVRRSKQTLENEVLEVLVSLPDVGIKRAKYIIAYYGSIKAMVNSNAQEMADNVPKIQISTANKIYAVIEKIVEEYGYGT